MTEKKICKNCKHYVGYKEGKYLDTMGNCVLFPVHELFPKTHYCRQFEEKKRYG